MPRPLSSLRLREFLSRLRDQRWFNTIFLAFILVQFLGLPTVRQYASAIFLRRLPIPAAERVYTIAEHRWSGTKIGVTEEAFANWKAKAAGLESLALYSFWDLDSAGQSLIGARVSEEFFTLLGIRTETGRDFHPSDFARKAHPVVLLSHQFAEARFGSVKAAVGKILPLEGRDFEVVGVLPPDLWFLSRKPTVWLPISLDRQWRDAGPRDTNAIGRLRPGVTPAALEKQLSEVEHDLSPTVPERFRRRIGLASLRSLLVGDISIAIWMLMIPFGTLLVSTCILLSKQTSLRHDLITLVPYMLFLFAKMLTVGVGMVCLWVALQDATATMGSSFALAVTLQVSQDVAFFLLCIKVAHWCALDQKYRCRICLARMRMPVMSGTPNSILLDRSGDEYICTNGHGQLYVPSETPADKGEPQWTPSRGVWEELLNFRKS